MVSNVFSKKTRTNTSSNFKRNFVPSYAVTVTKRRIEVTPCYFGPFKTTTKILV